MKTNKKFNSVRYSSANQEQTYLQTRLIDLMPTLMLKVVQNDSGQFIFEHPKFPDLRVEGITLAFVEEHVERAIKRHFRGQSNKHIDYLLNILLS